MHVLKKVAYIAFGGLLVATGMIISPLNAQKDKFGDIECTSLKVVTPEGTTRILLNPCLDRMPINDTSVKEFLELFTVGAVIIGANKNGGRVAITSKGGASAVTAINDDGRAEIMLIDKHGILPLDTTIFNGD